MESATTPISSTSRHRLTAGELFPKAGEFQRRGVISQIIGSGVEITEERQFLGLAQQSCGVEVQRHRDLPALGVGAVDLQIRAGELEAHRWLCALQGAFHLQDLRERQLSGRGAAAAVRRPVQEADGEDTLEQQLAAHDLRLRHSAVHPAGEDLRRSLSARGQVHLFGEGEVLLRNVGQDDGVLLLLLFFDAQFRPRLCIRAEA